MGAGFTGPRRPQRSSSPSTRARTSWAGPWGISSRSRCRGFRPRSEEHTSELQSQSNLVCRLLLEKKKKKIGSDSQPTKAVFHRGMQVYNSAPKHNFHLPSVAKYPKAYTQVTHGWVTRIATATAL